MFEEERMDHEEMDMLTEENDIDINDNERWNHWGVARTRALLQSPLSNYDKFIFILCLLHLYI